MHVVRRPPHSKMGLFGGASSTSVSSSDEVRAADRLQSFAMSVRKTNVRVTSIADATPTPG